MANEGLLNSQKGAYDFYSIYSHLLINSLYPRILCAKLSLVVIGSGILEKIFKMYKFMLFWGKG